MKHAAAIAALACALATPAYAEPGGVGLDEAVADQQFRVGVEWAP
jgi:hypothetical protein